MCLDAQPKNWGESRPAHRAVWDSQSSHVKFLMKIGTEQGNHPAHASSWTCAHCLVFGVNSTASSERLEHSVSTNTAVLLLQQLRGISGKGICKYLKWEHFCV